MHPSHQFPDAKRFGDVVIRPQGQTADLVVLAATRGEHEDGNGLALRTQAAADGQAVLARHHHVEHQHIKAFARQQHIERACTIDRAHGVALVAEVALQQGTQVGLVISDQDFGQAVGHGAGSNVASEGGVVAMVGATWTARRAMHPQP